MRQRYSAVVRACCVVLLLCTGLASCGTPVATVGKAVGSSQAIETAAFGPGGALLATANPDASITIWDMASGQRRAMLAGHGGTVTSLAFSPDGKMLASGALDKRVELWDVTAGKELRALNGHTAGVSAVAFSPDGKTLASGGQDGAVFQWEVASGTQRQGLGESVAGGVTSLAYSPDGQSLVSGGARSAVQLWNAGNGQLTRSFTGHKDAVGTLAFSPDGQSLATGSNDREVKLWSVQDGKQVRALTGHTGGVAAVSFSPDGKSLATGSVDRTARLWDATSGQSRQTLSGHNAVIPALAFSPDGKSLATGSRDNSARQWDTASGQMQKSIVISPLAAVSPIDGFWDTNYGPATLRSQPAAGGKYSVTGFWIYEGLDVCKQPVGCRGEIRDGTFDPATKKFNFTYFYPWDQRTAPWELTLTSPDAMSGGGWNFTRPKASPSASASATPTFSLVSGGDFECPPIASSYQTLTGGQALCGWLVKGQSIDIVADLWPAAEGKQSVDLNGTPGAGEIEQYFQTVAGQTYRLRFALAGNFEGGPAEKKLAIIWDGNEIDAPTFDITGRSAAAMGWVYKEYTVTGTGNPVSLTFRSLTEGGHGPVIDDVSVVVVR